MAVALATELPEILNASFSGRGFQLVQCELQHDFIESMTPAKAVDPRQEPPAVMGVTLLINNARQYLVMQDFVRLAAIDHRLINQLETVDLSAHAPGEQTTNADLL